MLNNPEELEERRRRREQARQEELRKRHRDELLQIALAALELGQPLDAALEGLARQRLETEKGAGGAGSPSTEDLQELQELLQLASALRSLPHVAPQVDWARQLDAQLAVQAGMASPNGRNHSHERQKTMQPESITQQRRTTNDEQRKRTDHRPPSFVLRPAYVFLAGLAVLLVFAVTLTGLGLYLAGPHSARAATLMDTQGQVEVLSAAGSWTALADGARLQSGQRLRTGPASQATLVFFDGTRTSLEPNADVTLNQVAGEWGGVLRVSLTQNAGHTRHSVVPLRGQRSAFTVLTPSGAASVHGTHFDVLVESSGASRFGVETGRVLVSGEQGQAFLTAGQATEVQVGGLVETPAYQFSLQGNLTSVTGSTWIVDGVPFTVTGETTFSDFDADGPQVNDEVRVTGRVLDGGAWVADHIQALVPSDDQPAGEVTNSFTGILEANSGDVWQIAGWTVVVDGSTQVEEGLSAGDPVRVTFKLMDDGRWLAVSIVSLEEPGDTPPATGTAVPADPTTPQPDLVFTPAELKAEACDAGEVSLSGSLANLATGAGDYAEGVKLSAQVVEGAQYVELAQVTPDSIAKIDAGGSASFTVKVTLNDTWPGTEDGEVKLRVFASTTSHTEPFESRLTVKIENDCEETEEPEGSEVPITTQVPVATETLEPAVTLTPTITSTLPVTPTVTLTPTVTVTPEITGTVAAPIGPTDCTGAQPHPVGTRLAEQFGVPYEEIMGWFCQGFGFGEIELAYGLSYASYGTPNYKTPAELFALKAGGMGWGEIKQMLETRGNPKKWVTPPPTTAAPGNPKVQSTPVPYQQPGNPHGNPNKPPKPPKPNKP